MVTTSREEVTVVESTVWDLTVTESTILDPEYSMTTKIVDRGGEVKTLKLPKGRIDGANAVSVLMGVYSRWTLFIGVHQQGILTFAASPSNNDTVTIGTKVYTFQTVLTNSDGNVLIGADQDAALQNLTDAINLTGTAGTQYAAAMTAHPDVEAVADATANTLTVIADTAGASTITTTETSVTLSWGGVTLDAVADAISITVELSPDDETTYYTAPESPLVFTDAGEDVLEFGYDATHIRLTGSNAIFVTSQVRGTF